MNRYTTEHSPNTKGKGRRLRSDLLLIGALLAITAAVALLLFLFRTEGDCVTVTLCGDVIGTYPLSEDAEIPLRTGDGEQNYNLLIIKDGKASVSAASCPDGICKDHRPISHDGESIICLPHKIVIAVDSSDS